MAELIEAILEEQKYVEEKLQGHQSNLLERLKPYGFNTLDEYFNEKREYLILKDRDQLFNAWKPSRVEVKDSTWLREELIPYALNDQDGIYIYTTDTYFVTHGHEDKLDPEVVKTLNIDEILLEFNGGCFIGDSSTLAIMILSPSYIGIDLNYVLKNYKQIFLKYFDDVIIDNNDILINGKKVMASYEQLVKNIHLCGVVISFKDFTDIIKQACHKTINKKPGYIDSTILSKEQLLEEVLSWLLKS